MSRTLHHRPPWASQGSPGRAQGSDDRAAVRKGYLRSTLRDQDGYPDLTRSALLSAARPGERKAIQRELNRRDRHTARHALRTRSVPPRTPRRGVTGEL